MLTTTKPVLAYTLLLFVTVAEAQVTRPEVVVPYVNTNLYPLTIDGQQNDWRSETAEYEIAFFRDDGHEGSSSSYGTTVLGTISNRDDAEVLLRLAHDGRYLYALAVIIDDLLEQRSTENNTNEAWREDALQLYIDSTNAREADIPDPPIANQEGYEQFSVSTDYNCYTVNCDFTTNNTTGPAGPGAQPDQTNWLVEIRITGAGPYEYVFEERIPLSEIPGHNLRTMQPGQSYGFNAEFVDSDNGVYLQGWMFWSSDGTEDPWRSQDKWGTITLESIPDTDGDGVPDSEDAFPHDAGETEDVDGDGLGDNFEQRIVDNNTVDTLVDIEDVLPQDDFDADGVSNLDEFRFHLDPTDGTSQLPILGFFGNLLCALAILALTVINGIPESTKDYSVTAGETTR